MTEWASIYQVEPFMPKDFLRHLITKIGMAVADESVLYLLMNSWHCLPGKRGRTWL